MQVNLFKKKVLFENKKGEKVETYNYYIACGCSLVSVRCSFFEDLRILKAFASDIEEYKK